jgi:hypothetical protein
VPGPALLERIDRVLAELLELRAAVANDLHPVIVVPRDNDGDDLSDSNLIDSIAAQERFGHPSDSIRKWCRTEGLGVKRGGRWLVSVPRLQRRINGK